MNNVSLCQAGAKVLGLVQVNVYFCDLPCYVFYLRVFGISVEKSKTVRQLTILPLGSKAHEENLKRKG